VVRKFRRHVGDHAPPHSFDFKGTTTVHAAAGYYRDASSPTGWNNVVYRASACRTCCGSARAREATIETGPHEVATRHGAEVRYTPRT